MIPQKLQIKVFAPQLDPKLVSKVIPIFHRWITERALNEILVDVADYRHVFHGPGITLIGHESTYHVDEASEQGHHPDEDPQAQLGLVCFRKRGFKTVNEPLLDALRRALTACELLERELSAEGKLFDAGSLKVGIADRTAITPLFQLSEFAALVNSRLAPVYQCASIVKPVHDGNLPSVRVRCEKKLTVSSILTRITQLRPSFAL